MEPRLTMLAVGILFVSLVGAPTPPQTGSLPPLCFDRSGATVCISEPFRAYWLENGGVPVFGYPLAPAEVLPAEQGGLTVQYFERTRLEFDRSQVEPFRIAPARLGLELHGPPLSQPQQPQPGCVYFDETGFNLCEPFLTYWRSAGEEPGSGSMETFGAPISEPLRVTEASGETLVVQWFERARFEQYANGAVGLGPLGLEARPVQGAPESQDAPEPQGAPEPTVAPTFAPGEEVPTPVPTATIAPIVDATPAAPSPEPLPSQPGGPPWRAPTGGAPAPNIPCNRNVPTPEQGIQVWVTEQYVSPPKDAVVCVRLIDEFGVIQGVPTQVFFHTPHGVVPSIHHTTGFEGVADFIFYVGDLPVNATVQVQAVAGYSGRSYEAWTSFVRIQH